MNIALQTITLHNFAGIRDLTLEFGGNDAVISGENAAGKTTVIDAFLWLLFDKNSAGQSDFAIKTQDRDGAAIHNLEHEVTATLAVDGKAVTLRKLYREVWTKKRGLPLPEHTGHETAYWIADEPHKFKDYKAYIDGLISEDLFRLLTDPKRFNDDAQIKPDARRKILLDMCGDISPEAVIASDERLTGLREILGDHGVESMRKIIADKRRKLNDELDKIPAQIEALTRSMPELRTDYGEIESELRERSLTITALDAEATEASKALDVVRAQAAELSELEIRRKVLAEQLRIDSLREYNDAESSVSRKTADLDAAQRRMQTHDDDIAETIKSLRREQATLEALRADYDKAADVAFPQPGDDELICKYCGQAFPADKREEHIAEARAAFNAQKTRNLQTLRERGKAQKDRVDKLSEEQKNLETETPVLMAQLMAAEAALAEARNLAKELAPTEEFDPTASAEYIALTARIDAQRAIVEGVSSSDTTSGINTRRNAENARIRELMQTLAERDAAAKSEKLIADYTLREAELGSALTELDGQLFMLDQYTRAEAALLEGTINGRFENVKFRLFEEQINGGLRPTCVALVDGVPFNRGLNEAARVNAGLEIIDALGAHYGVYAPVLIDRCESVLDLRRIKAQTIRFVVAEDDDDPTAERHRGANGELRLRLIKTSKQEVV
jgi:hypothetical protein